MIKKVGFHIAKGGTGKTSLSGNCAFLSSANKKTILIDGDPQGNASSWLLTRAYDYELSDILRADGKLRVDEGIIELSNNFYIMPTRGLAGGLKDYAETKLFREPYVFDDLNGDLENLGFEVIIYDLSPGLSQLERYILLSCYEVVIPVLGEFFSIDGIETATTAIEEINKSYRKDVKIKRLVVNNINLSFRRHIESYKEFQKLNFEIFAIAQDSKIAESQFMHKPLSVYYPRSRALPEFQRLTSALMEV